MSKYPLTVSHRNNDITCVCLFLGGYLLAYTPHTGIQCYDLDDATCFPMFNKHVRVSVDQCTSVIFLLIMRIIIKIQSHSGVIYLIIP